MSSLSNFNMSPAEVLSTSTKIPVTKIPVARELITSAYLVSCVMGSVAARIVSVGMAALISASCSVRR